MRPVNLIPPDERRGARRPARTGPLAYLLVGALVAVLAGVTALVLTGNTISEREAEVAGLEQEEQAARARAESLRAFADFAVMQQARAETVSSLARSRFDWERVLRELALVLPDDVWLVSLSGKVSPEVSMEGGADVALGDGIAGPSLAMTGCAAGHESAAGFVAALEDIDGVTRVGLATSERTSDSTESSGTASGSSAGDCPADDFVSKFEIVVAFDGVAVEAASPPVAALPTAGESTVADAAQQQAEAGAAIQESAQQAEQAVTSTQGG